MWNRLCREALKIECPESLKTARGGIDQKGVLKYPANKD
jgi:hypothetical protein